MKKCNQAVVRMLRILLKRLPHTIILSLPIVAVYLIRIGKYPDISVLSKTMCWYISIILFFCGSLLASWIEAKVIKLFYKGDRFRDIGDTKYTKKNQPALWWEYWGIFGATITASVLVSKDVDSIIPIALYILLLILYMSTDEMYYSPLWVLLGYNYYTTEFKEGQSVVIISRQRPVKGAYSHFDRLKKINEFVFFDVE